MQTQTMAQAPTEVVSQQITITIHSSQGQNGKKITTMGNTPYGDLVSLLKKEGYNMNNVKVVNARNKMNFEHPKALIPNENFNLHIFPNETKGGSLSRSELYTKVKGYMALGEKAVKFFNDGQNFTRKSSTELETLVNKWEKKHGTGVGNVTSADKASKAAVKPSQTKALTPKVKKERVKGTAKTDVNVADVVASVAESKEACPELNYTIEGTKDFLKTIVGHENQDKINQAVNLLEQALIPKPTKSEMELLREEHDDLYSGLSGVKR